MRETAVPLAASWRELPLPLLVEDLDGLELDAATSYPETRIGLFDFSEPTRTEPFPYVSASSHRACGASWPEVTSGTRFFLSQDTYRGNDSAPPSLQRYVYTLNNPVKYTDPSGN